MQTDPMATPDYSTSYALQRVVLRVKAEHAFRVFDEFPEQHLSPQPDGTFLIDEPMPINEWLTGCLHSSSLSSLNDSASIWCCIENILLASASEGIFGVTRIPMAEESAHIQEVIGHPDNYVMPCYIALGYPAKNASRPKQKHIQVREKIHMHTW